MNEDWKNILIIAFIIITLGGIISIFILWYNEPELTTMQMIMKYWNVYAIAFGSAILRNALRFIKSK